MDRPFSGKLALVTGGTRGIGRAVALKLAGLGADLIVNYSRSESDAARVIDEVASLGAKAWSLKVDLGDVDQIRAMFRDLQRRFGGLDVLVNCAARGLQRPRAAVKSMPGHLRDTFDVNVLGPWFCTKEAIPLMEARGGGAVVNVSSLGSRRYMTNYAAVGVTKAALESLTMYLAVELAPRNIRVNSVCPGWVAETGGIAPLDAELGRILERASPAGRHVTPEDVANVVAFLCGPGSEMVIGQNIVIDGGVSLLGIVR